MKYFKKNILISLILFIVIAIPIHSANALELGTGLEAKNSEVYVNIVNTTQEDNKMNITEKLIRSKIELKLRQNDIKVLNNSEDSPLSLDVYLTVLENKLSSTYFLELFFSRPVIYSINKENYLRVTNTWKKAGFGRGKQDQIINHIEGYTDIFINEFHKENDF